MRRDGLLNHAKRTFPYDTPEESFIGELVAEAHRRGRRNPQNKVWNADTRELAVAAKHIYPTWLEWSEKDENTL